MTPSMTDAVVNAAIAAIESESATLVEKIEMLIEMATRLQEQPKEVQQLHQAIELYKRAIDLAGEDQLLLRTRAMVGMATAWRSIPGEDADSLLEAKALYEAALPVLQEHASPEEVAEAEMNLGLVLQSLVPFHRAKMADCIQVYQRALRVFTADAYPQEYAILHNNIAIAYLSIPMATDRQDLRQAIAVQTFEQALLQISLIDHPNEYAMLQNNLGNALQYLPSVHAVENNQRAVAAYDEALKVRNAKDTPLEYANTIANKANALVNLPDQLEHPELGNPNNLQQAYTYYQKAVAIFNEYGQLEQARTVALMLNEIEIELNAQLIHTQSSHPTHI